MTSKEHLMLQALKDIRDGKDAPCAIANRAIGDVEEANGNIGESND